MELSFGFVVYYRVILDKKFSFCVVDNNIYLVGLVSDLK